LIATVLLICTPVIASQALATTPPTLTVKSPQAVSWMAGSKYDITWSYTGNPGAHVKIELSQSGSPVLAIAANASIGKGGAGSYTWTIPLSQPSGSAYQISITSSTNSSMTATGGNFTITQPAFTVESPPGGPITAPGLVLPISWTYTGNPGSYVKIDLLTGSATTSIASKVSIGKNGSGSFNWTILDTVIYGNPYQIKISSTTDSSAAGTSKSFTVSAPTLTVLTEGTTWTIGKSNTATFNYTGKQVGTPFLFELSQNSDGSNPIQLATLVTGPKSCSHEKCTVQVPIAPGSPAGSMYLVMVGSPMSGQAVSAVSSAPINVVNKPTKSAAGPDQKVTEFSAVKLSGANSVAQNGAAFRWSQLDGPPVTLFSRSGVQTGFLAPEAGESGQSASFELTVTDRDGAESRDFCIVNVAKDTAPPTADAGANQTVAAAQIVELDGSGSSAHGAGIASYEWKQVSGVAVGLSDPSVVQTTFAAPDVDSSGKALVFELTVTDQAGLRSRARCIVNVTADKKPPVAHAGISQTVMPGSTVVLDGSGSTDYGDGIAAFSWRQTAGPPVTLSNPAAVKPTFTAPVIDGASEELVFELTVTDAGGLAGQCKAVVSVENDPL
jgi:hypothetical protein